MERSMSKLAYTALLVGVVSTSSMAVVLSNTYTSLTEANNTINQLESEIVQTSKLEQDAQADIVMLAFTGPKAKQYGMNMINDAQRDKLVEIYNHTAGTGYQLTLTAIAWRESMGAAIPINLNDPSCGPFHNKVTNVMKREGVKVTSFSKNQTCARLISDLDFAVKHAILEIDHWNKKHNGNWRKMMASYNGGNRGNKQYSAELADIVNIVKSSNIHLVSMSYPAPDQG